MPSDNYSNIRNTDRNKSNGNVNVQDVLTREKSSTYSRLIFSKCNNLESHFTNIIWQLLNSFTHKYLGRFNNRENYLGLPFFLFRLARTYNKIF